MKFDIELSRAEIQAIVLAHLEKTFELLDMDADLVLEAYGHSHMRLWPRDAPREKEEI